MKVKSNHSNLAIVWMKHIKGSEWQDPQSYSYSYSQIPKLIYVPLIVFSHHKTLKLSILHFLKDIVSLYIRKEDDGPRLDFRTSGQEKNKETKIGNIQYTKAEQSYPVIKNSADVAPNASVTNRSLANLILSSQLSQLASMTSEAVKE